MGCPEVGDQSVSRRPHLYVPSHASGHCTRAGARRDVSGRYCGLSGAAAATARRAGSAATAPLTSAATNTRYIRARRGDIKPGRDRLATAHGVETHLMNSGRGVARRAAIVPAANTAHGRHIDRTICRLTDDESMFLADSNSYNRLSCPGASKASHKSRPCCRLYHYKCLSEHFNGPKVMPCMRLARSKL